jgi:hypothetical protein
MVVSRYPSRVVSLLICQQTREEWVAPSEPSTTVFYPLVLLVKRYETRRQVQNVIDPNLGIQQRDD